MDNDHFRHESPFSSFQTWITVVAFIFMFIILCSYCCIAWQLRQRRLWSNVDANPTHHHGLWNNVNPNPPRPAGQWNDVHPNPPRPAGIWSNVDLNPSRPAGPWSIVDPNPSRPAGLWSNVDPNPSRPVLPTAPPVLQSDFQTPIGDYDGRTSAESNDVPPDYMAVVDQRPMAADAGDDLNRYPSVVATRKSETPPPDYMTVSPFK